MDESHKSSKREEIKKLKADMGRGVYSTATGQKIVFNLFKFSVFLPHRRLVFPFRAWKEVKVCLIPVQIHVLIFVINPSKQFQEGKPNPLLSQKHKLSGHPLSPKH